MLLVDRLCRTPDLLSPLQAQAWFNAARASKPQTFAASDAHSTLDAVAAMDSTGGPAGSCDFCKWASNTADDTFGRFAAVHLMLICFWLTATAERLDQHACR